MTRLSPILGTALAVVAGCDDAAPLAAPDGRCASASEDGEGAATRAWTVPFSLGRPGERAALVIDGNAAWLVGTYAGQVAVGNRELVGSGTYVARLTSTGTVERLDHAFDQEIAPHEATAHAGALWAIVPTGVDLYQVSRFDGTQVVPIADLALDGQARLTAEAGGVWITGVVGWGTAVRLDDVTLTAEVLGGHGFAWWIGDDGARHGWIVDGNAGAHAGMVRDATASFTVGRFGGNRAGERVRFGAGPDAPTLESVSPDDDPAWDVFVGGLGGRDVAWAKRVRSYTIDDFPPAATVLDGDLVTVVSTTADETIYDEGLPTEVRIGGDRTHHSIARFGADGSLRWAREAPREVSVLWTDGCDLWSFTRAFDEPSLLTRSTGDGVEVGTRTLGDASPYGEIVGPGTFIGIERTDAGNAVVRYDY